MSNLDTAKVGDTVAVDWDAPMCPATLADPEPGHDDWKWECTRQPHGRGQHVAAKLPDDIVMATWQ